MNVGLLLITHDGIGQSLLTAASNVLGSCPLSAHTISIENDSNIDQKTELINKQLKKLDKGKGVLILTDMYGSTPSNISCKFVSNKIRAVSGVNLPMLVRVLNYPNLDLKNLISKATSGGKDGVISCNTEKK